MMFICHGLTLSGFCVKNGVQTVYRYNKSLLSSSFSVVEVLVITKYLKITKAKTCLE